MLCLAVNIAQWAGFWSQNTKALGRGVLTEESRPVKNNAMIKTYYNMTLHCNAAIFAYKLNKQNRRADLRHCC